MFCSRPIISIADALRYLVATRGAVAEGKPGGVINGEHDPREAAATSLRIRTEQNDCLPLDHCSGWLSSC